MPDKGEADLATGPRQCRRELRVGESHEQHDDSTGNEGQSRPDGTGALDHLARQNDPTPAHHGTKGQRKNFPPPQESTKLALFQRHQRPLSAKSAATGLVSLSRGPRPLRPGEHSRNRRV